MLAKPFLDKSVSSLGIIRVPVAQDSSRCDKQVTATAHLYQQSFVQMSHFQKYAQCITLIRAPIMYFEDLDLQHSSFQIC